MKHLIVSFASSSLLVLSFNTSAFAFSVAPRTYSQEAIREILTSDAIMGQIPSGESISSVEQVSTSPYQFAVKAGACTLTVELSVETPPGFIGTGLARDPKVVEAIECNP